MNTENINILKQTISNIARKEISENKHIAYIYVGIIKSINSNNKIDVQLPNDYGTENNIMTFKNKSGETPSVGQGCYILTVNGNDLTGAFVIALM